MLAEKYRFKIGDSVIVKVSPTDKRLHFKGKVTDRKLLGSANEPAYKITGFGDYVIDKGNKLITKNKIMPVAKKKGVPRKAAPRKKVVAKKCCTATSLKKEIATKTKALKVAKKKLTKARAATKYRKKTTTKKAAKRK